MSGYNKEAIGRRIRKLRNEKGFTRDAFSECVNLSNNFIYEVETNRRGLSAESMFFMAQALGVTMDYLTTGEDIHNRLDSIINLLSDCTPKQLEIVESTIRNLLEMRDEKNAQNVNSDTQEAE